MEEIITVWKVKAPWGDGHSISAFHVGCPYCLKGHCAGLGWNNAKSLYGSWHRAVFGFVLKTGWKHRGVFVVAEQSQGLFCFSYRSTSEQAGREQGAGRQHSWDSWPQLTKAISLTMWWCAQQENWVGRLVDGGGTAQSLAGHMSSGGEKLFSLYNVYFFGFIFICLCYFYSFPHYYCCCWL